MKKWFKNFVSGCVDFCLIVLFAVVVTVVTFGCFYYFGPWVAVLALIVLFGATCATIDYFVERGIM